MLVGMTLPQLPSAGMGQCKQFMVMANETLNEL